ncbi:hypothetical protein [uncultured Clostridium sp.]|uniref:hypothetical protein n=1 Tax=uncultured Clostridium sp. TaxID=59620 RepID=UPI0025E757F0|nr:hypothetical protein [uncultured Clostridium sp.]
MSNTSYIIVASNIEYTVIIVYTAVCAVNALKKCFLKKNQTIVIPNICASIAPNIGLSPKVPVIIEDEDSENNNEVTMNFFLSIFGGFSQKRIK